jgi:FlaA1/EpsC-like NDP-sugar epimerase
MMVMDISQVLLGMSRFSKRLFVIVLDVFLSFVTVWLAYYLRIDQIGILDKQQLYVYALAPTLAIPIFIKFGLYRAIFRYTGMAALMATAKAVGVYSILFFTTLFFFNWREVPRSVGLIQPLLFLIFVGGSRAIARFWLAGLSMQSRRQVGRLLIYGAGEAGVQTATALSVSHQYSLQGFVDDDSAKIGGSINGVDIMSPQNVAAAVHRLGITDILLAIPSLGRSQRNNIIANLRNLPVHVRTLPGMGDLAAGRVTVQDFQELDVEDLLGRSPVLPDQNLLKRDLVNKVILVTGAGGSIGSELCRQIIHENPKLLLLVDHSEFALYSIHRELIGLCKELGLGVQVLPLLGSVRSLDRLRQIFFTYKPETVYHAAAYKHVPLVESNPSEGIVNNVFGTLNVARVAMECRVSKFVLISTDKAVRPTNVMGATKRMAELVLQAFACETVVEFNLLDGSESIAVLNKTIFSMVRFGNVLGSSGSVIPLFRGQLKSGGPITVTHKDVTRYFMTIPEASQLVLTAGAMAQGGDVFVLEMGDSVKILDLAKRMVQLSGLSIRDINNPSGDIEIIFTGLRPGEKLYEELLIGNKPQATLHPRIIKAREDYVLWEKLVPMLVSLNQLAITNNGDALKVNLMQMIGNVAHVEGEN